MALGFFILADVQTAVTPSNEPLKHNSCWQRANCIEKALALQIKNNNQNNIVLPILIPMLRKLGFVIQMTNTKTAG